MDNDNKITEIQEIQTHNEVQLFLKDELDKLSSVKVKQYNLEEEYARTKKNKNKSVIVILASCALAVSFLVAGLTLFITSQNRKIKVNIDTFNDLNLRALLNSAGRTESLYENALQSKEILVSQKESELNDAARKRDNDLYILKSVSAVTGKDAVELKTRQIQEEYEKNLKSIHQKYDFQIQEADLKIADIQKELSGYDTEKLSVAQADEAVLDSQKQLNDMKMQAMEKKYQSRINELKSQMILQQHESAKQQREAVEKVRRIYQAKIDLLDPDARSQSEEQDKIILETGISSDEDLPEQSFSKIFNPSDYTSKFKSPEEVFESSVKKAASYLDDFDTVADRFISIPQERSIRHYVPAMQRLAHSITEEMAGTQQQMQEKIDSLKAEVESKNAQITDFEKSFEEICISDPLNPADACIKSAVNKNILQLYVASASKNKFPDESISIDGQIREGKRVLCELTITKKGQIYTASPKTSSKTYSPAAGAKVYFVFPEQNAKK